MFNKFSLKVHILILYGFLGLLLLSLCSYSLLTIASYEKAMLTLDREPLPLARTVAEISRHQLDQTLRFNEILLYARTSDREKFELSNEGYVQAGKRMGDEILEGRNFAQRGIEKAESESRLKELDAIKTLLKGIEKAHGDYEHLGALLIRSIYQYDFLLKKEYLASGDHISAEEEATKHITFVKTTLSALEDETRRLESGIKEAVERVKQLSQTMAAIAKQRKENAFNRILPLLFFALSMGLLLVFAVLNIQKGREFQKNKLNNQSLGVLSQAFEKFQTSFQSLDTSGSTSEQTGSVQKSTIDHAMAALQEMVHLSDSNVRQFDKIQSLVTEKKNALDRTGLLVQQLNQDAGTMLVSGEEIERAVRALKEGVGQIRMLATNASAEALRLESTRSFSIFTEEINKMAQSAVLSTESIANHLDSGIKNIRADRLHASQTQQRFSEVIELARKEADLFTQVVATIQKQSILTKEVQSVTNQLQEVLENKEASLERMNTLKSQLHLHVEAAQDALVHIKDINSLSPKM